MKLWEECFEYFSRNLFTSKGTKEHVKCCIDKRTELSAPNFLKRFPEHAPQARRLQNFQNVSFRQQYSQDTWKAGFTTLLKIFSTGVQKSLNNSQKKLNFK